MDVQVSAASRDDAPVLAALLELYVYDFSAMLGFDVGDDGRFRTPSLDAYWTEPTRHAFLTRAGGALAGFALVVQTSRLTGDPSVFDMAEFFVLRRHRRHGVGERIAHALFDRFRGPWEVRERAGNTTATAFWRRAIGSYTGDRFDEVVLDDDRWRGPVQCFDSRGVESRGAAVTPP